MRNKQAVPKSLPPVPPNTPVPSDPADFITYHGSNVVSDPKFKTQRHRHRFELEEIEKSTDPQEILRECFKRALDASVTRCKKDMGKPDKVGLRVISEMLDYDFWLRPAPYNANTLDNLMNRFNLVDQSAKPTSMLGAPFSVEVTTICADDLQLLYGNSASKINGRGGRHGRKRKAETSIEYAYFEDGLFKIFNPDEKYCLFHAVELARLDKEFKKNRQGFHRYRQNYQLQLQNVKALMTAIGAPKNLATYDATIWLPRVQVFYDQMYPGLYKIFIFGKYGNYRPLFKTGGIDNKEALCLFYDEDEEHFDVIPKLTAFLAGVQNYCFACERPYKTPSHHKNSCIQLCKSCRGIIIHNY